MTKKDQILLPNGIISFPAFLPDGTRGVVRALGSDDLNAIGTQALVMNTFHLMQKPGSSTIQSLGGLHKMSAWKKPIMTDSGGFQAYSVIRNNPKNGNLSDKGISFRPEGSKRKYQLTPEKSIQLQMNYGADILVCLDDCTHVDDAPSQQETSVNRTLNWAKKCKSEFVRLLDAKKIDGDSMPKLFAVIQGGGDKELRELCANELLEIGFDGYGFGGWPLDSEGKLLDDILGYTRSLIPEEFSMHALGVGHPEYVLRCFQMGYEMFDSALPTRDARRGRLYLFKDPESLVGDWFGRIYINDLKHIKSALPISEFCDCYTCQNYSRGYLHHLFKINDHLFYRLTTIHNLRFMSILENRMRESNA